jgi:hypothetical protein
MEHFFRGARSGRAFGAEGGLAPHNAEQAWMLGDQRLIVMCYRCRSRGLY